MSFMKNLILFLLLINCGIGLNAQRSDVRVLKIDRKYEASFISDEIQVQSDKNNPFIAFSIALRGESINQNIDRVYYKNAQNQWQLFINDENNYEKDAWFSLAYLDKVIIKTQIKIIFNNSVHLGSISFNFYFPKDTDYLIEKHNKSKGLLKEIKGVEDCGCARPTTIPRDTWCPNNNCPPNSNPIATNVKFLVVHHTAGSNTSSDWAAVVRSIWNFHVNTRGWADIGYNFLLDRSGKIYDGRADDTKGAHFSGHNSETSGMALLGTFLTVVPTNNMLFSLDNLLVWKSCNKDIDPLAIVFHTSSGLDLHTISGHRDGGNTQCPGDEVYNLLPSIRNSVNSQLNSCALSIGDNTIKKYLIYPNPFNDEITIDQLQTSFDELTIQCFDTMGRLVFDKSQTINNGRLILNLDSLSSGIYILKVKGDEQFSHYQLIKN